MPSYETCILDTQAKPPSLIPSDEIIIHEVQRTSKGLFINASWEEPDLLYGEIVMYELRVGKESIQPNQDPNFSDSSYLIRVEVCNRTMITSNFECLNCRMKC